MTRKIVCVFTTVFLAAMLSLNIYALFREETAKKEVPQTSETVQNVEKTTHEERTETHEERTASYQQVTSKLKSLGNFTITAYCPCSECSGEWGYKTASGKKATANRTVAADTSVLPFGTEIYIDGKKYIVEDRGGAVRGNHIDIFFLTHEEAEVFGRKRLEVFMRES